MESVAADLSRVAAPAEPLKVLIVDDQPDCREALEIAVRSFGYSCSTARDGVEAWEMYAVNRADVILSDWMMPRLDGLGLCRKVREDGATNSYTHFIFVTGNGDKAHFIHGMSAGADDYIAKPVDMDELQARLMAARRVVMLNRELRELNSSLRHDSERANVAARTDHLTEAFNRLALEEDLEGIVARISRYGRPYCAALCDVDAFKAYNDHFGHLPGDEVLRHVARTIQGALRGGDTFYRYGGEEFLVILPEQSLAEASSGMDRVRRVVERLAVPQAPGVGSPFVTISVGISMLHAAGSVDDWLRRTDGALYVAKARGRNCVAVEGEA